MTARKPIIKAEAMDFRSRAFKQQMYQVDQTIESASRDGEFSCMYVLPGDAGELVYAMITEELEKRNFKIKLKFKPPGNSWWGSWRGGYKNYTFKIIW